MLTNILQAIGNTPLLRLGLSQDLPGKVWLKLENRNPGGSIKDRVAFHLIENALQWGELEPGGLVVEATSGNMGIGIALVSAVRGLRCVLAMPESMSIERRNLLKGLGAELVQHGATADARFLGHHRRRGGGVAMLVQYPDRGCDQQLAGGGAAFSLRAASRPCRHRSFP